LVAGIDGGGDQAWREAVAEAGHGLDAGVGPLVFACLEFQPQRFVRQAGGDRDESGAIDRGGSCRCRRRIVPAGLSFDRRRPWP
jgi:hypothetical protein